MNEAHDPVKGLSFCRPLGGGIEFGETGAEAVVREIREEIGAEVSDVQYVGTLENIFTYLGKPGHEIVQVFDGRLVEAALYERGFVPGTESDGQSFVASWRPLSAFGPRLPLFPDGLIELLRSKAPTLAFRAMTATAIESIPSFVPLTSRLATAGQPSEEQLLAVAAAGFKVVINLGLHGDPAYSLADEEACVAALGLVYVHIPVQFASPSLEALAEFSAAMERAGDNEVFVHCRHNKRVPVFVALDRVLRQGWEREEAFAVMHSVWLPDATWQAFIDRALAKNEGLPDH